MTKVYSVPSNPHISVELLTKGKRKGATIYNASNKNMYVKLGVNASSEDYSLILLTGSYWEVPTTHKGPVHAAWASGCVGKAQVSVIK